MLLVAQVAEILNMSNEKTTKVNKRFERGGSRTSMYKHTEATLDFNMKNLVKLPPGEDLDDFIGNP